jgi:DNA sulfur modification protein DndD
MAFVQAVLAASSNPVPLFVDTPLARLDSTHREAVVSRFWPALGRQVIVLSTDEEVVADLLDLLEPNLVELYLVDSGSDGSSSVTTGAYFERGTE